MRKTFVVFVYAHSSIPCLCFTLLFVSSSAESIYSVDFALCCLLRSCGCLSSSLSARRFVDLVFAYICGHKYVHAHACAPSLFVNDCICTRARARVCVCARTYVYVRVADCWNTPPLSAPSAVIAHVCGACKAPQSAASCGAAKVPSLHVCEHPAMNSGPVP